MFYLLKGGYMLASLGGVGPPQSFGGSRSRRIPSRFGVGLRADTVDGGNLASC